MMLWIMIGVIFVASVPFEIFIPWLFNGSRHIHEKLDKPTQRIRFSSATLQAFFVILLDFFKGYAILFALSTYLYVDNVTLALLIGVILCCHFWSVFRKFRTYPHALMVVFGMYVFMEPTMLWVYPLLVVTFSLLFNAIILGWITTIVLLFFGFWFYSLPSYLLPMNFVLFLVAFMGIIGPLLHHIETKSQTLLAVFKRR